MWQDETKRGNHPRYWWVWPGQGFKSNQRLLGWMVVTKFMWWYYGYAGYWRCKATKTLTTWFNHAWFVSWFPHFVEEVLQRKNAMCWWMAIVVGAGHELWRQRVASRVAWCCCLVVSWESVPTKAVWKTLSLEVKNKTLDTCRLQSFLLSGSKLQRESQGSFLLLPPPRYFRDL